MSDGRFALFDCDGGHAILLSQYRRTVSFDGDAARGPDLASLFAVLEAAADQGEWIALAADYALGECFEPSVPLSQTCRPMLRAWVFGQARRLDPGALEAFISERLAEIPEHDRVAGVAHLSAALDAAAHAAKVEQIRRWIAAGDCYQINLTFPLAFRLYGHPWALYARLRARQTVRHGAYIVTPEETLLSFSPELFFERVGSRVVTRPMKGTAERGISPGEDAALRASLLASEKERAENIMIVDLLRNDLGKLAQPGKVQVESLCDVEAYPTLWQLVSTVSADLPGVKLFDLFRALFPCGSITGAPKIRAMQRIAQLEVAPRGLYTGALGWLSPGGDCRFNVAIRTLEVAPDGQGTLGVGSGIVIDSSPASEYAECLLKSRFLTRFDPGFGLIETLCLERGVLQRLELHLERLQASAQVLGFACDIAAISAGLAEQASMHSTGPRRIRLTLAHDGRFQISQAVLEDCALPALAVLAEERVDPGNYLLGHKTSARRMYDRALARLAGCPDFFDAVFLNTRGEVCEGARSNVFIERDGVWLTPPTSSGLLPGVMRRQLLESGRAIEAVLFKEDLLGAPAIYLTNSLRGVIPVRLQA
ncbi:MAG: aminodeoxychorismate synthase component I [Propionivibrio sp.]|uniref:aminodeoxychorismate synthase component I n=1 Tax=Propionivibrio sp. TaxID=2212460 RepID=UPI0025F13163|nr:aminodeoxychorismate synthase component I [Propionivibrio sp.]MBK7356944.1 aminodeoxychorismate synthase component I [Propionivibrio sp.]MBK8401625.1 aminodeoxychorismate synthase component I [Propionivibrio sp.]